MHSKTAAFFSVTLPAIACLAFFSCGGQGTFHDSGVIVCQTNDTCPAGMFCNDGVCAHLEDGEPVSDGGDGGSDADGGDGGDVTDSGPGQPDIETDPIALEFGNGRIGVKVERLLVARNVGDADLTLLSLALEAGTSTEFNVHPIGTLNITLIPGEEYEILVSYTPVDGLADQGALLVSSNDPDEALLRVPLSSSYKGSSEITLTDDPAEAGPQLAEIDFGDVPLGASSQRTVYLKNTGRANAVLAIDDARTEPPSSLYFSVEVFPDLPAYLSPDPGPCADDPDCEDNAVCNSGACVDQTGHVQGVVTLTLRFSPGAAGSVAEALIVTNDEDDAGGDGDERPLVVPLVGRGILPTLEVEPNPIDFNGWFVGQQAEQTVRLHNIGQQDLMIDSLALESGAPFTLDSGGQSSWTLAPDAETQVTVGYAPLAPGAFQDTLIVTSNDPESPARVDVLASAVTAPAISAVPAQIDFGEVQLSQIATIDVQIANNGGSDLVVSDIRLASGSSDAFSVLQSLLPAIAPGQSRTLNVIYYPTPPVGADGGTIEIESNDPATPVATVGLSGLGTDPAVVAEPAAVDFGPIYLGFEAGPATVSVRNAGFGTLTISAIGLASGTEPDFSLRNLPALPADLSAGESVTADLYYTPLGTGLRSSTIQVLNSDQDNPLLSIPIAGTGSDCPAGHWDIDGDPGNGCEYACDLSHGGVEDCDGEDNDCDAQTDEDLASRTCSVANQWGTCNGQEICDGSNGWVGCDASTPAEEICDTIDNNCSGFTDAGDGTLFLPPCEMQAGACAGAGHRASLCINGIWNPCETIDYLANNEDYGNEDCDAIDNNCDGATDEGLTTRSCYQTNNWGSCPGTETCSGSAGWTGCDAPAPEQEICDTYDNNCDGLTDTDDGTLLLAHCDLQAGVCAGAVHRAGLCVTGSWQPCQAVDYGPNFGVEVCGNSLDEDCSGAAGDKDTDGDGFLDVVCGGDDCNDLDPATHPGATEIQDTRDNDCDTLVDEGLIPAGAVIVTEIMKDPSAVSDTYGEYLELTNVWSSPVNLDSWTIRDDDTDGHQIVKPSGIVIGPGRSAVLCRNDNASLNGGVVCDYDYDDFALGQTSGAGDEVVLELNGVEIDRVVYLTDSWPSTAGHSMNLDPAAYDSGANDLVANWCNTPTSDAYKLPGGDWGTPGEFNPTCSGDLAVLAVDPVSGIDAGGETVTIIGSGFTGANAVKIGVLDCAAYTVIDDTHISCTTPAQPAGDYDLTVVKGVNSKTLSAGYRYTSEAQAPDIDWCVLQFPAALSATAGAPTPLIFGRVYKAGVTEPAGPPAGITAQVGYGAQASDPRTTPGWAWFDAVWNPSCPDCGNDDEFMRSLTVDLPGSYSYAYRFSEDGGYTFVYADLLPGTTDGFSTAELGALDVH
ncbi:MAG TPA: choice-of-anchor D domain-containing protein [Myxococcota bacterium]|nr:choice-of-anchor D domain-containing protein [Myxococcota bacterium]